MIVNQKNYQLILDDKTGNIMSFSGLTGYDYIESATPLIKISFLDEQGNRNFAFSEKVETISNKDNIITATYKNLSGTDISCKATLDCTDSNFIKARLSLKNNSGVLIESIEYPCIIIKNRLGLDNYKLFWSAMEGVEIDNVDFRTELMAHADGIAYPPKGWAGVYPGACPMQFMAYYNGEHGLYFASHDAETNFKMIEWLPEGDGIRLIQQLFPACAYDKEYEYNYDVVLGAMGGTWYDAAEIYRNWLYSTDIIKIPKLLENKNLPKWVTDPLVVITFNVRGTRDTGDMTPNCNYPYTNCLPYIDKFSKIFDNRIMTLLMHWEGSAPWAPPYVWPPYGDQKNFEKFADEIHKKDNLLGLYCSGIGWTQQSGNDLNYNKEKEFEQQGLADSMGVGTDQVLRYTNICGWPIRNGYDMCPACKKVKDIVVAEAEKISQNNSVDYLQYFDQNLGGNTYPCYSKQHPHPPVPGKWMETEMLDVIHKMQDVFDKANPNKKVIIGGEAAACEPMVNSLFFNDLRYNLDLMYGIPVPAYNYMFGEYVVNFMGNHTTASRLLNTKLYPDNLNYRFAYSFLQGDVLTFMLKNDGKINWEWNDPWDDENEPHQENTLSYVKLLNDWRNGMLYDCLRYGKMVKPIKIICGKYVEKVDRKNLVRMIDEVLTARYITPEGRDFQIFINYRANKKAFSISKPIKGKLYQSSNGQNYKELSYKEHELEIPGQSVIVIEYN